MSQDEGNNQVPVVEACCSQHNEVDSCPSSWPKSTVHPKATMFKTRGLETYRLKASDIKHLEFDEKTFRLPASGDEENWATGYQFSKKELEDTARKKYSSPAAMEEDREAHRIAQEEKKARTTALKAMQEDLMAAGKEWLWSVVEHRARLTCKKAKLRDAAILAAQVQFIPSYPSRPAEDAVDPNLHQSKSFTKLYEVIAVSDKPKDDPAAGSANAKPTPKFTWNPVYNDKIYGALNNVVKEHGRKGWEAARWLVYDQYAARHPKGKVSLKQTGPDNNPQWQWEDPAAFWLDYRKYKMGHYIREPFLQILEGPVA